jgi:MFS family permease
MASVLNDLFFPQADPLIAKLLAAFAFCSTYFLRPVGGFVIGWIGDRIGRKSTIMITTTVMATACVIIASLPTYSEIGITASIVLLLCRVLQGFSSLGEIVGAELYLAETLKQPQRYLCNALIEIGRATGGAGALLVAMLAISINLNWRIAFWIGAGIAFVGLFARVRLRETPEFVDFKRRMAIRAEKDGHIIDAMPPYKQKLNGKTLASYFIMHGAGVAGFYMTYVYMGSFMKETLGFTYEQVINQNLGMTIVDIISVLITMHFLLKYHPVKIARVCILLFVPFLIAAPYLLGNISGLIALSFVQIMFSLIWVSSFSMEIACFSHLPIPRRFTLLAVTYGLASATAYTVMSFGLIPLTKYFGYYGIWIIYAPLVTCFMCGVSHIKKLEIQRGTYLNYPDSDDARGHASGVTEEKVNYDFEDLEAYTGYNTNCDYAQALIKKLADKPIDLKLVEKAIIFAKKWHSGQKRKTGEPYYAHPCKVASMLSDYTSSTNAIIAAILHDVVEDSACTIELIAKEFNPRIAQIVQRLTRLAFYNDKVVYDENHNKIKLSIEEIGSNLVKKNDAEALITKQLDRLHNLETSGGLKKNKRRKVAKETMEFLLPYVAIAVDRFNINDKLSLEEKMHEHCKAILTSVKS